MHSLTHLDLSPFQLGRPQWSGRQQMVPLFGQNVAGFVPPSSLKLDGVKGGYGNLGLSNPAGSDGVAIVPLHLGYIQRGAQNHALCRAAFLAPGETVTFTDACCVQAAQGGYLEGREQWFFILPRALRRQALNLRGQVDYSKLWPAISDFNRELGLPDRGHLEELLVRNRSSLEQFRHRFELQPDQKGALFFQDRRLVGVELAPNPVYFSDIWMALTAFCYGPSALQADQVAPEPELSATTLAGLRHQLELRREERDQQLLIALSERERLELKAEESYGELKLHTAEGRHFAGQLVERGGHLVYASVCRN